MKRIKQIKIKKMPMMLLALVLFSLSACKKQDDWLDVKRSNKDVVPSTLKDFQAILDQNNVMNSRYPQLPLLSTDNVLINDDNINAGPASERNAYIFAKDIFEGQDTFDWDFSYQIIECTNIVLDGLKKLDSHSVDLTQYNNVKGSALFYRAFLFYQLAQMFSKPYIITSATTELGIPIRQTSDVNTPSVRPTLQQTYQQIITDLQTAASLLPVTPAYKTRPSQIAANALLAKVYLSMGDYSNANRAVNDALSNYNTLLDYNSNLIDVSSYSRFPTFSTGNPEMIFDAEGGSEDALFTDYIAVVDLLLYNSYADNDLRKTILFSDMGNGQIYFAGSYAADGYAFSGIATNELYLIRAECEARSGDSKAAIEDLNALLVKRWKTGTFVPHTAMNSADALKQILVERRKELPFTGMIRWEDLRRLNSDPQFAVTITHTYNGTTNLLAPNDKKYTFPIPEKEIQIYGLPQNER